MQNPRELFTRKGIFNPLIGHRQQRVLRRHLVIHWSIHAAPLRWRRRGSCRCCSTPRAGHDLPLDDPAWVAGQVRDWLYLCR